MTPSGFPTRKISETLIDFAQPFLVHVDKTTSQETIQQGFHIAVTIWNVVVLDKVNGNSDLQNLMRKQLGERWQSDPLINTLVNRRLKEFSDDMRLVSEHQVVFDASGFRLKAAAIDPYASKKP